MLKNKGKKMLLWIVPIVLLAGVVLTAIYFVDQIQSRKSELFETILSNPATTAMAAYTIDAQGNLLEDGSSVFYNADTPLVLASTMKVAVLAAYESAVVNGELDPHQRVAVTDLEKYYLPKTDGNAHINGLTSIGIKTDELGFAIDQNAIISLDDIAKIMIHYSGNAETDYLIARLGIDKVNSLLAMEQLRSIRPVLGVTLALMNHENTFANDGFRSQLITDVGQGDIKYLEQLENLYLNDPTWRTKQIEFMRSGEYIEAANQLGWDGQVEAGYLFPKGTAREYAALMARIASGKFISPEVSANMQQKLESTPSEWLVRLIYCHRFGAKDGLTAGVINLVSYCEPKSGPLAGQTRVMVIFTNDLPVQTWSAQVQYQGIYFLQMDIAKGTGNYTKLVDQ